VVNRITGAKKNVKASELFLFLKKHTLFEVMPEAPVVPKKARGKGGKPGRKPLVQLKPEEKPQTTLSSGKRAFSEALSPIPVEPLILTLAESQTIFEAYAACAGNISDWAVFSAEVCDGKFPPNDVRLVAEEFQPAVHFRPASGMVVIDRQTLGTAEAKRRRIDNAAAKVEEIRKTALAGVQAADASKARALGISRMPHLPSVSSGAAAPGGSAGSAEAAASVAGGPSVTGGSVAGAPMASAAPGANRGSAEVEFVRDVLQAAQEWIQVIPTVATRDSMTMLLIRAAQATLGQ
jgi:hypothetical protein